ncbi:MAG: tRNA (adenosine(37)-N6)-threonylcarbamoyltransferase complex transferase subunit TsaD [Nitrospirae bacterium]|nr:tRNA (adenosine(37)-N6)-threonylcarbamoyltransferase complex transferase subunit TsaD [Candidatus Manganitrophaceae bacterium]
MIILSIESSCDETAIAILRDGQTILADLLSSQIDLHQAYGGVVPELACRRHIEIIGPLLNEALAEAKVPLAEVDAIAVTAGPGLIGALLVGVSFAKSLAYALGKPLLAVHHLEGHISAAFIEHPDIVFPAVALVVSGGHTNLYAMLKRGSHRLIGRTVDDAAGEAFDKGARMLGLGYPGGPIIDRLAKKGDVQKYPFTRPYRSKEHTNFSFSGLKTALRQRLEKMPAAEKEAPNFQADICAGFQDAIVGSLVEKTLLAAKKEKVESIIVCGGVASNSLLREWIKKEAERHGLASHIPSARYCTDNGAMIAMAACTQFDRSIFAPLNLNPSPSLALSL